jgi:hypothetical protein
MRLARKYVVSAALTIGTLAMQSAPGAAQTGPLSEQEAHAGR